MDILSVMLGFSIVLLTASSLTVGFFQNEGYIKSYLDNNKAEIIIN
jgi:hypothetical protein